MKAGFSGDSWREGFTGFDFGGISGLSVPSTLNALHRVLPGMESVARATGFLRTREIVECQLATPRPRLQGAIRALVCTHQVVQAIVMTQGDLV